MVLVVDYGMGNLRSVSKALESLGARVRVSENPQDISKADHVVLPGVGAFGDAMQELDRRGLREPLLKHLAQPKPFLGVCLGLQVLFETSEEAPGVKGFGFFSGPVCRFAAGTSAGAARKVPHMGWNRVRQVGKPPLLEGIPDESFFYFVHSYYPQPSERSIVMGETEYGVTFAAVVGRAPVFASQFHPEKSQRAGLTLLANFLKST